jgi:hypothetical protein
VGSASDGGKGLREQRRDALRDVGKEGGGHPGQARVSVFSASLDQCLAEKLRVGALG